jgi:hypothetical protein
LKVTQFLLDECALSPLFLVGVENVIGYWHSHLPRFERQEESEDLHSRSHCIDQPAIMRQLTQEPVYSYDSYESDVTMTASSEDPPKRRSNSPNAAPSKSGQAENPQDPSIHVFENHHDRRDHDEKKDHKQSVWSKPSPTYLYIRNRVTFRNFLVLFTVWLCCTLTGHRILSHYMTNREWVAAPITYIERTCPRPDYSTLLEKAITSTTTTASPSTSSTSSSKKPRICITTLTDSKSSSRIQRFMRWRNYDAVMDLTWENKEKYAMKHGYSVFDGSHLIETSRPPAWTKIRALQHLLDEEACDWGVWLDADTVIMNSDIKIESFLPADDSHDFLVGSDDRGGGHNSGVMLFRNTLWSKQFLDHWWNMKSYVRPPGLSLSGDNNALKALIKETPEFDQHVLVPPRCTLNSFARFYSKTAVADPEEYMSEFYYHKGDFIAHVAGYDNKAGLMRMLLKEAK